MAIIMRFLAHSPQHAALTLDKQGTLIPSSDDITSLQLDDDTSWILVVEKEASANHFKNAYRPQNHPLHRPCFKPSAKLDLSTMNVYLALAY